MLVYRHFIAKKLDEAIIKKVARILEQHFGITIEPHLTQLIKALQKQQESDGHAKNCSV